MTFPNEKKLLGYQRLIEAYIQKLPFGSAPDSLYEPVRYLMLLGGKRIRPMLTLLAYSLFKKDVHKAVPYAVAVEAFHNFTLMHDDIMDSAPLRRGKVTVHKKWNVNTAILSGDVMLVKVYAMFAALEADRFKHVIVPFNRCAAEVCEGQQWDMDFEKRTALSEKEYIKMITLKTAVLLGFSLELGGILAGADERQCQALRKIGIDLGIGFQLMDDYLDAYGDPKKFGKQVGGDIIANKKTFLLVTALEQARGRKKQELLNWLDVGKSRKREKVIAVKQIFDELNIPHIAQKKIKRHFDQGLKRLRQIPVKQNALIPLQQYLSNLAQRQT